MKKEKEVQPSFFKELGVYMKPYKIKYVSSIIVSILGVAFNVASFAFVGLIASNIFKDTINFDNIILFLILAILSKLFYAILLNSSTWISHKAAYLTLKDIRLALSEKMLKLPMGYFESKGSGRLKTLLVDHVENMEKTLAHMLPELTANLLIPCVCMVWMFFIDWRLALAVIIWIIIGFSVTGGLMNGYEEKYAMQISKLKGMNQAIVEYVNGIEVIKNFGREGDIYNKYKEAVLGHAYYNINWQKSTQAYSALGMAIAPFSLFPVLILSIIFLSRNSIDASTVFMMIILTFGIFTPLMNTMNYYDQFASMSTNAKEIKDVLDYKELERGSLNKIDNKTIEFKNVSFSYDECKVLDNISFKSNENKMLALVGPSGSGKSTIAKLIAGYWDCNEGEILIGNHNIKDYSQDYINNLIAYVDQDTFLFDMSIKDNIKLGNKNATDEDVINASKKANCHDFIMKLPNGYDTLAGEAGNKLSGGEKQRIAIVRAMMKNAPIMILDEATASCDPENEAYIQEALQALLENKTLIVVAHRLYTIKNADKILYIDNGKIKQEGTHEELLNNLQDYKNLWLIEEGDHNA